MTGTPRRDEGQEKGKGKGIDMKGNQFWKEEAAKVKAEWNAMTSEQYKELSRRYNEVYRELLEKASKAGISMELMEYMKINRQFYAHSEANRFMMGMTAQKEAGA